MLVWADGFDNYGTTASFLGQAGYSTSTIGGFVTGRTGPHGISCGTNQLLRRPLNATATTLGQGVGINPLSIGTSWNSFTTGIRFESAANTIECSIVVQSDLSLGVFDRTGTFKGATPANQLAIGTWTWVEVEAINNNAGINTGYVEIRINGFTQCIVNGINLPNVFASHALGSVVGGTLANLQFDDYVVWDGTGTFNNTFMSDRRLYPCYPNANGASQDFTPSAGSAFNCINLVPPVDTTYIEGTAAGNTSTFDKQAIGVNSNDIAAVVVVGRLFKTDSGIATGSIGVQSGAFTLNSPAIAPGTSGAFYQFVVERDPNGNVAWTEANANNALLVVNRVS